MIDSRLCFVAMPFRRKLNNLYDVIEATVSGYCGLRCVKADDIALSHRITDDIRNQIKRARIVLADLTDSNPNVFYEVGLAHGREKRVILLQQKNGTVPFDLSDTRCLEYDVDNLTALKPKLIEYVKNGISTIPQDWNRTYKPPNWTGAYIKITSLDAPAYVELDQRFDIRLTAKNTGNGAHQGYFSISFPDGVDNLTIDSNIDKLVGRRGDPWGNGNVILRYPIAEAFRYGDEPVWRSGKEFFINLTAYPKRRGLLWFYVNASSYDGLLDDRRWDPDSEILDIDQRGENVYCGVIDVR